MYALYLQVDAVKRNCLKVLPHTLVIHLKRFEFDYETMTRWKIKDRRACCCSVSRAFQLCWSHSSAELWALCAWVMARQGAFIWQRHTASALHEEVDAKSVRSCSMTQQR